MDHATKSWTATEAAAYLGRSAEWLRRNARKLGIPHSRIGRSYEFRQDELDLWRAQQKVGNSESEETSGRFGSRSRKSDLNTQQVSAGAKALAKKLAEKQQKYSAKRWRRVGDRENNVSGETLH